MRVCKHVTRGVVSSSMVGKHAAYFRLFFCGALGEDKATI